MAKLVLTAIGSDRAGLVSALSGVVADLGGNWLESQMARLAGKFAGIALVDLPSGNVGDLVAAVQGLRHEGLLDVTVTPVEDETPAPSGTTHVLHLIGHDRPGILFQVSDVLASQKVTIDELHTLTSEAPMAGGLLFEANAVIRTPVGLSADDLRAALETIADELMVDLDLEQA